MAEIVKKKLWPKFLSLFLAIMMITGTVVYGSWAASAPVGVVKIASLATAGEDGIEIDELEGAELNQAIEEVSESENIRAAGRFLDKKGVKLSFAKVVAAKTSFKTDQGVVKLQTVANSFQDKGNNKWTLVHLETDDKIDTSFSKTTDLSNGKFTIKSYRVVDGKVLEADSCSIDRKTGDVLYTATDGSQRSFNINGNQGIRAQGLMKAQAIDKCLWCKRIWDAINFLGTTATISMIAAVACLGLPVGCVGFVGVILGAYNAAVGPKAQSAANCKKLGFCK